MSGSRITRKCRISRSIEELLRGGRSLQVRFLLTLPELSLVNKGRVYLGSHGWDGRNQVKV